MNQPLGDRHLRHVEGLAAPYHLRCTSVRIVIGLDWAASTAGQLLASCLVNLLCRQDGVVGRIEIDCPTVECIVRLPDRNRQPSFPLALCALAEWAVGPGFDISATSDERIADQIVYIGNPPPAATVGAVVFGFGWKAWIGQLGQAEQPPVIPVSGSTNPHGPFLAAALAAGEIFKATRSPLRQRNLQGKAFCLWSGESANDVDALADGPELDQIELPPFHLVGAGAVGNDFAYILANAKVAPGQAVVLDDDHYDRTSLNRCLVTGATNEGDPKVATVHAALQDAGFQVFPFEHSLSDYLADTRRGLSGTLAVEANELQFGVVISCVDRGISRQTIQALRPRVLLGGSTLNMGARANIYTARDGSACLACFNPAEKDGERLRAMEKRLRDATKDERANYLKEQGVEPEVVESWIANPTCGSVGEATVKALAARQAIQFSVGFVSLGAALLLTAKFFRASVFREPVLDMTSLNFLNGGLLDTNFGPDPHCEAKCQEQSSQAGKETT